MAKQTRQELKKDFLNWLNENNTNIRAVKIIDDDITKVLASVGVEEFSMYDETEVLRVRLYISDLIIKREKCKDISFEQYLSVLNRLVLYAEYLERKEPKELTKKREKKIVSDSEISKIKQPSQQSESVKSNNRDLLKDTLTVAYYLSRINKGAVETLGYKSFSAAFDGIAKLMGQKATTIKNMRDEFDPYFENGRAGWYQREMSPSRKDIYDYYKNVDDKTLEETVCAIINTYKPEQKNKFEKLGQNHTRLKISNEEMKVCKSKRK